MTPARPALVQVKKPRQALPGAQGALRRRARRRRARGGRHHVRHRQRGDGRPGGRIRLRQDHHRADDHEAPPADGGRDPLRRPADRQPRLRAGEGVPAPGPDGVPGPVLVAEPADDGGQHHRLPDAHPERVSRRRPRRPHPRAARAGGAVALPGQLVSPRVQRGRAPAGGHRHRARPEPEVRLLRRAGLLARRLRPGADPESPEGHPQRVRPHDPDGDAQPERGGVPGRSRGGDVPRQDRRGRGQSRSLPRHAPPLQQGAGLGDPHARSRRGALARADHPARRDPEPAQSAVGMPLPHAMPVLHRRHLPGRRAGAARGAPRPLHRMPPLLCADAERGPSASLAPSAARST